MSDRLDARLDATLSLAAEAGALAQRMRPGRDGADVTFKGAQDWLTAADGAVEQFLSDRLSALFPGDGFQGEEAGRTRSGALRWVVDPIDGTSNYAHGGARWCVSIGLIDGDRPVLGVIAAPDLHETFAAATGRGATLNGTPIRAAATTDLRRGIVECGWSPRRSTEDYLAMCARVMAAGSMLRAGGSGALGLADVAAGRLDAYLERHINLWDVAAGLAILAEAGAWLSPFPCGEDSPGAAMLAAAPGVAEALQALM
jgi:myo-inositol-1(or 4)-monophosphatase